MNSTQKNIIKYKNKLPHFKEKLIAAGLLFVIAAGMLATTTFAWVSLSLNPQISNVNTSIASNGNLEIALAQGEAQSFSSPGSSKVGDSVLDNYLRNVTWGNLVNLNDSRYGLKNLVLRPALLNEANLVERPLYGPVYDGSGRVIDMNTNFGYSLWNSTMSRFEASDKLGVRAITSMTYGESGAQNTFNAQLNLAESANARFQENYVSLANNQDYMDALASMMTGYMVQNILKVNSSVGSMVSDATLSVSDLKQFAKMYQSLVSCFEEQAGVYANLLNLQATINQKDLTITAAEILLLPYNKTEKTAYNTLVGRGYTTYSQSDKTVGIIKDMDSFLYDYKIIKDDLERINYLISYITDQNKSSISWPDCPLVSETQTRIIDDIINNLTNVGECTITGGEYVNLKIKNVGATAALALKDAGVCETKITNGILYNMDNRSGARIRNPEGKPLSMTVKVMGTQTIRSNVSTSATDNYFENERVLMAKTIKEKYGAPELIAKDSYGFAVDFWVRTNAANSYLTLQGNVLTRTDYIDVMEKDLNGELVQIYTITVKTQASSEGENTQSGNSLEDMMVISYDVYKSTYVPDGATQQQECWRFAENHQVVTEESLGGQQIPTPLKKVETKEVVIGYEGDNRVWEGEEHSLLSVSSTTQGSGSCYVFYADTPVEQQRSLELLKSMKVAFVDSEGNLLATALMDTEHHYASTGKVIVPLVLDKFQSVNIGVNDKNENLYAITALEQNVPKRITAIVYLDGTALTNDKVLSSADIEGHMNIQFGSSTALIPLVNEALYNSELYAEVQSITPNSFDYDKLQPGQTMTSNVKVKVTGTQPQTMTATFIRQINATQGSPEKSFTLTDENEDGIWEGSYTFLYPGEYILRSVVIDGAERELKTYDSETFPTVVVNGFSISSVVYSMKEFVMTDSDSYSGSVYLTFGINDPQKMPKTVVGNFIRDDGVIVNVNFSYNPTLSRWQGEANFVSSGEYTMQYLVLDGQYVELPSAMQKTVDLTLGMRLNVETISPTTIFYGEESAPESLKMQVKVLDNNYSVVENLAGVSLTYTMTGTETLYTSLVYNSGEKCYEGEFPVESGTWKFSHVTIEMGASQTNTLVKVNADAPVFTVVPPTPPSYVENIAESVQYVSASGSATFTVSLKESGSAAVYAKLVNVDKREDVLYVLGTLDSFVNETYNYIFDMPGGLWELESVSAFGVFDINQNYHAIPETIDDESYVTGIIFNADNTNGAFVSRTVAVLYQNDISATFDFSNAADYVDTYRKTVELGKNGQGTVTATFMQQHTLANNSVTVTINDSNNLIGRGYFSISDVSLSYKYGNIVDENGVSYGGYTSDAYDGLNGTNVGTFKFINQSASKFTLNSDGENAVNFQFAAQYTPDVLKYRITSSHNEDVDNNVTSGYSGAYKIEVYSNAPTVTITDITMDDFEQPYSVDVSETEISDTWDTNNPREEGSGCNTEYYYKTTISDKHITAANNTQYISKIVDEQGNKVTSGLTAYMYFRCLHDGTAEYEANNSSKLTGTKAPSGLKKHVFDYDGGNGVPAATLTINGISTASKAVLTFAKEGGGDVQMFTKYNQDSAWSGGNGWWTDESNRVNTYEWTADATSCKRFIGYMDNDSGTNGNDKKTAAGTLKANVLVVTYNGKTYSFTIPQVTIHNPF